MGAQHLHNRLGDNQAKAIFENYVRDEIGLAEAMAGLGLGRARFFKVLKRYKADPATFTLAYGRTSANHRISPETEAQILTELQAEKKLIENKDNPITTYNYSAVRDMLLDKHRCKISVPTIIRRAKEHGFYRLEKKHTLHTREVLTNFIGELVQHDTSYHQWSPYMAEKLYLITSL